MFVIAILVALGALILIGRKVPVHELVEYIRHLGPEGLALFGLAFVLNTLTPLPSAPMFIAAGLLYGVWWGTLITTIGSVAVELLVIRLVRTRVRRWLDARAGDYTRIAAIDRALATSSFCVLWLFRLSPAVPFGLLNYAMAPLQIPLRRRITANVLGMGPGNLAQAYVGSLLAGVGHLAEAGPHGVWRYIVVGGGLALTLVAVVLTSRAAKLVLRGDPGRNLCRSRRP